MGQIIGSAAKPKRCNLNKLSQLGILAAGEHVLVSYDNSMNAAGQGNFDRYIVGNGRTAATALELKYLDDSTRPYIVEEVNKAVADIQPIEITGDVTNAPDEEDLTSENQGGTDVLKFKDKAYNSALYSGLGRTYLRKNIVTLEGTGKNVLTQAMVNTANTIYHIQYDYDLNGQTLTIPDNCVLLFDGGSFSNGGISIKDCAIFDGKFSDVFIGFLGGKITISGCDIKRTTSITGIKDACILLEGATKKADIEICGCTISNEIGSGASSVYGLAIKLIGQVETYFNIHDNYVYCNGSMTIETQPSGDNAITGMLSNNTIISDQTTYNMAVSFPDGKGEKLIENNIITGYIEVSQGLVIRGNKITGAGTEESAIVGSATGTSDTSKAVIIDNNVINGVIKMVRLSCNLQITSNYIAGILWFAALHGAENKIMGNTIIKDRTYTLNGGSRHILYTSEGCDNLVFTENMMFSDIFIYMGSGTSAPIWKRNKLHITTAGGSAVVVQASGTSFCDNEIHVTTLNLYYSSYYKLFGASANLTGATLKDNEFVLGNLSSMLADTKIKYVFHPASYTVTGIIESGNRIQGWTDIAMGTTAERPNLTYYRGNFAYLDTTINLKIFWGSDNKWWGEDGNRAAARIGDTASRPTGGDINVGFEYYDTELGKFVYAEAISGNSVTWKEVGGLTFDTTPTAGSNNPVTSAGIKTALDAKANTSDVYTKVETYTKNEVNNLIVPANTTISVVSALPASGSANTIYRVPATNYYSDYGWDGSQFVLLATYNNAIDNAPKYGSHNLVESGGVWEELIYSKTSQQGEFSINQRLVKIADGSLSSGAAWKTSQLYPLQNVAWIQFNIFGTYSTVANIAFYSSEDRTSYISGIAGSNDLLQGTITSDDIPTGAAYVSFTCQPAKGDSTFGFNYAKSVRDKVRELDEAIQALLSE